ncbi:MAG: beta-xylosidase [Bryobacteraceae bacterium]
MRPVFLILLAALPAGAQSSVTIRVDAANTTGPFRPIHAYFGYDEPNFTYANHGRKLLGELGALGGAPVYVRTHFLLTSGDGTAGLKWGSTNAYTEDASGHPVYDWAIVDRIFDTWIQAGVKPFVEIGFMPAALSSHPDPYQQSWIPGARNEGYFAGWTYPPRDYSKWAELVYQWVRHAAGKYGREEVESWYWELWNEPDIGYWHGSPEEYDKLYDYTAAAVKRALPTAKVGGPATTGPGSPKAAAFLRQFLDHCAAGTPLDFITFHAKGRPEFVDGHVRMGISKQARDIQTGCEIVSSFPKFRNLPIILSESDPEGCAACSAQVYPPNAYRNGTLYPAYTAAMLKTTLDLALAHRANIAGMLTWAFEFENQPYFAGFRTLATNGVDKPVLNLFRMAARMRGDRLRIESSGAVPLPTLASDGVRGAADVDALAARSDHGLTVLAWNYHDDDLAAPDAAVQLRITGLSPAPPRATLRHYRIDQSHSNAYTVWKNLGSPREPSPEQQARLEASGQLLLLEPSRSVAVSAGAVRLDFPLPRQAVSLIELEW